MTQLIRSPYELHPSYIQHQSAGEQLKLADIAQLHYASSIVHVGTFNCPPSYPYFQTAGNKPKGYLLAFPRTSVYIQYAQHKEPIVADPNVVMLYNPGQVYKRQALSQLGDITDWFAFRPDVVRDIIRPYDPYVTDREKQLFVFSHGRSTAEVYFLHRLVQQMVRNPNHDTLFVEETLQAILEQVVAFAYYNRGRSKKPARAGTVQQHRELVEATKSFLAQQFTADLSLDDIAQSLYTSTYHLCRVFRQQTGQTIHNYRNQLRLRVSLDLVAADEQQLTEVALSLGYASHSHFTTAFKNTFKISPSGWRDTASFSQLQQMSKILKA